MIKASSPVDHKDYHTLDLSADDWWARMICFQAGETCAAFLLQHHLSPIQGLYKGVYDHETELVLAILSGESTVDLGTQIAQTTALRKPEFAVNVGSRKALRFLKDGELDALFLATCQDRGLTHLSAGTDDKKFNALISPRLKPLGFTKEIRHSAGKTTQYVWTKEML